MIKGRKALARFCSSHKQGRTLGLFTKDEVKSNSKLPGVKRKIHRDVHRFIRGQNEKQSRRRVPLGKIDSAKLMR